MTLPFLYGPTPNTGPAPLVVGVLPGVPAPTVQRAVALLRRKYPATPVAVLTDVATAASLKNIDRLLVVGTTDHPTAERAFADIDIAAHANVLLHAGEPSATTAEGCRTVRCPVTTETLDVISPLFAAIDAFNRSTLSAREVAHWHSQRDLLPDREMHRRPQPVRDGVGPLLVWYAVADSLALAAQRVHQRAVTLQIVLILLATYLVRLAVQLPDESWWAGAAYGALAAVAGAVTAFAGWRGYRQRHVATRGLAEAVRVLIFWRLAGLSDSAAAALRGCLGLTTTWTVPVVRTWELLSRQDTPAEPDVALVRRRWCAAQLDYIRRKCPRLLGQAAWASRVGLLLIVLGGSLAGASITARLTGWFPTPDAWVAQALHLGATATYLVKFLNVSFGIFLTVLGTVVRNFVNAAQLTAQADQLGQLRGRFEAAEASLAGGAVPGPVLRQLGETALWETTEWARGSSGKPAPSA